MLLLALAWLAGAQSVDGEIPRLNGQLFRPSIDADRTLWANDSLVRPTRTTTLRAALHYAHDPVVYLDRQGDKDALVRGLWQASIMAGHTRGPVRLGVDVPVYLRSTGSLGGESGLGDITPDLKVRLRDRSGGGVGLAVAGRLALPTTTIDAPLGNRGLGYELEGIGDIEVGRTLLIADLGLRGVPRADLENFVWDDALSARLAGSYAISDATGMSLELNGLLSLRNPGEAAALPAEALLGGYGRLGPALVLRGGVGTGITPGLGAPVFRGILALGWEPRGRVAVADADGDGIADEDDACPSQPEDQDGYLDADGCPEPTRLLVLVVDPDGQPVPAPEILVGGSAYAGGEGVAREAGAVSVAASAPGFLPAELDVLVPGGESHTVTLTLKPAVAVGGLRVVAVDPDGEPVAGAVAVLVREQDQRTLEGLEADTLPVGPAEVMVSADGMRAQRVSTTVVEGEVVEVRVVLEPAKVEIGGDRIDIRDSVYFQTNRDVIKPESYELLNEVAEILIAHPELARIRVEGHTDSRGSAAYNLDLSKRRAASVVRYLVQGGVAPERLESEGYGETKPLKAEETPEAWTMNRRVDFFVLERTDD